MKVQQRWWLVVLILLSAAVQADEESDVRAVLAKQQAAWNRGDINGYLAEYWQSPQLRFASGATVTYGYADTAAGYRQRYDSKAKMGELRFDVLEVKMLGANTALVFGRWHLRREKDEPNGLFTLVLEKFSDGWKVISDHTSSAG